jgi:hypothetical protein
MSYTVYNIGGVNTSMRKVPKRTKRYLWVSMARKMVVSAAAMQEQMNQAELLRKAVGLKKQHEKKKRSRWKACSVFYRLLRGYGVVVNENVADHSPGPYGPLARTRQ